MCGRERESRWSFARKGVLATGLSFREFLFIGGKSMSDFVVGGGSGASNINMNKPPYGLNNPAPPPPAETNNNISGAPTPSDAALLTTLKRSRSPPPDRATRFMAAPLSAPTDPKRPRPRPSASRVLHLGLPPGALASRILTVGDPARAALLASHLTPRPQDKGRLFIHSSSRGFTTYTGLFLSTPISIIR